MATFGAWQQNPDYSARQDRAVLSELFGEGVLDLSGGALLVTERSAGANMSVDVAAGRCVVDGDEQADQETYVCVFDDSTNLSVASADPDDPRKDRVIVRVQDSAVSGTSDGPVREVLTGTAGSGSAPAVPDSAISLAIIDVAAGTPSITDANITDDRPEGQAVAEHGDGVHSEIYQLSDLYVERSSKDSEGIFTVVEWFRKDDNSRYMRSELSGGTSPEYSQRDVTWYEGDGSTVRDSVTYSLSYDSDGDLTSEAVA